MKRAARGEFAKQQFVAITFADVTEAVIMILQGRGESGGDDVALLDDVLQISADVIAAGVQSLCVGYTGRPGRTAPGSVPPSRFSYVTPPVRNPVHPLPPSQNNRGRTTPREYPAMSAHPSWSMSLRCCQSPLPRKDAPQCGVSCDARKSEVSVAPRVERLKRISCTGSLLGRREIKFTTPAIAPAP